MRSRALFVLCVSAVLASAASAQPPVVAKPDAFPTLVNPMCSHCRDEAKRRAGELKADDRVLCWIRGYSDGGAIPIRFEAGPAVTIPFTLGMALRTEIFFVLVLLRVT